MEVIEARLILFVLVVDGVGTLAIAGRGVELGAGLALRGRRLTALLGRHSESRYWGGDGKYSRRYDGRCVERRGVV